MARRLSLLAPLVAGALALATSPASAAAPQIEATWVTDVTATSANLRAEINPGGTATSYRFDYLTQAAFEENVAGGKDPFLGATKAPLSGSASAGSGSVAVLVTQHIAKLQPATPYRFRAVATNKDGTTIGPERSLGTQAATNVFSLLDARGWELVSRQDKNGGAIQPPEGIFGGGVFQASTDGDSLTYSSADSFGAPQGAPPGSQYIATRSASGWISENITVPLLAGSYGQEPDGVPYQFFSADLSRGLLSNGQRCRGEVGECPVINPPLPGTGAPAGYRNYYLRDNTSASFESLLSAAELAHTALGSEQFEVDFAAASLDLSHVVLSSCAALTANAIEVPAVGGCDPEAQNLYLWSGSGLSLINLLPGETQSAPGAAIAAPEGAVSADASRVYWTQGGDLYLREGVETVQVDEAQGGGGTFETASSDGRLAFFSKASHLYRYDATTESTTDLTPSGTVQGVLGASEDGSRVYYLTSSGLFLWSSGITSEVAADADASNYPPATGTARVSPDGSHLLFLSDVDLSAYEGNGAMQAFLYGPPLGGGPATLTCVSCNPTGERPQGDASVPGAIANGQGPTATHIYKPRILSTDGQRVFFESADDLAIQDSNNEADVYQWEAEGKGSCTREGGCTGLVSNGRGEEPSFFIDASAGGSSAFFLTDSSLAFGDPGSYDLYVAREGGGFPTPPNVIPCIADACQPLPEAPEDPTPGTLVPNSGNPAPRFVKAKEQKRKKPKQKGKKKRKGEKKQGKREGKR